jgi:type IV pilus assembly protein PilQ
MPGLFAAREIEMSVKQLLGVLLLLAPGAFGAGSQLTKVSVAEQENATTVILQTSGTFTHTEFRPTDSLLLVDLPGVAAGALKDSSQLVQRPGVASYRVIGYTGSNGSEITRLEMTLSPRATVKVSESAGELRVAVEPSGSKALSSAVQSEAVKPPSQFAASQPAAQPRVRATQSEAVKPAIVRGVSVVRQANGVNVEIDSNTPVKPDAMRVESPDRLVIDIPNSVLRTRQRAIAVNGPVLKTVRVGLYQSEPPITRIVLDLTSAHAYELQPQGNKIVVKLEGDANVPAQETVAARAVETEPTRVIAVEEPKQAAAQQAAPQPVAPKVAPKQVAPKQVAEDAARVMQASVEPSVVVTMPAVSASPAMNPAAQQQAAAQQAARQAAQAQPMPPMQAPQGSAPAAGAATTTASRYTGEPISVNLKDVDLKDFFRLVHEISGLNIVLDPAVRGTLTLVLDDVPWDQALDIVLQNNGLDRRLEGNVLRIATRETFTREAESLRAQTEAQALAVNPTQYTHYLSYAHAVDVVPLIKRFLSARGEVLADPRTNALLIKDIPNVIPEVQRLLGQLDRKTQEVEIEARVVAATRNFARDIGTQLGFGWNNASTIVTGSAAVGPSQFGNPKLESGSGQGIASPPGIPQVATTAAIPLFSNFPVPGPTSGFSFSNIGGSYRIDNILTLAERRGLLKILSRPRIVTQNNIGATVKQGLRIPVVTAAQLGGPPTTSYIDAALRLQVTPQVTAENTIFLNVDVENTTPDFSRQVQGNPTLITQQATTSVLVNDGGTVVIGGVIQTQNSVSVQQVPLLGDLPILGNLFKRRSVDTSTQELIFFITPKIIQT